ncbi:hypothetical protein [Nocardioides sp. CER19]|nr:hypothetical protein [Nocardioides sp. CER19]MDH2412764.1 hypothetical protein [Nocardioides sp. CER19]
MSTDTKPLHGRHRAAVETRSAFRPTVRPMLLGGATVALVSLILTWQVL